MKTACETSSLGFAAKHGVRRRAAIVVAVGAALAAAIPVFESHLGSARDASGPRFLKPASSVNQSLVRSLGQFAFANPQGLWMTTETGKLAHLSTASHASDPGWSSDGRYLAYETAGPDGANPEFHVYSVRLGRTIYRQPSVWGFAWQPGHDRVAVWGSTSVVLSMTARGAHRIGSLPTPDGRLIWSSQGDTLIDSRTLGSGPQRYDQVYAVPVSQGQLGTPRALFRSPNGSGILLAASVPHSDQIVYWTEPQFSASLLADGTSLALWHAASKMTSTYPDMLPYPDYLTWGQPGRWAYMAGGPRAISGGKSVVLVQHGRIQILSAPQGREALEPSMNPKTGALAAVLAQSAPNASWGLGHAYRRWVQTRRLAVWNRGTWTVWSNAGRGVTDPVWLPNGGGILYLAGNRLWLVRTAHTPPQAVLGPIPSVGGYYGEILRSSLWSLHS